MLAAVDAGAGVPRNAVLVVGGVAAVVALSVTLEGAVGSASVAILVYYLIANLAALKMPSEARMFPNFVPWTGMITCAILAVSLDPRAIATGALVLAVGFLVRAVVRRHAL